MFEQISNVINDVAWEKMKEAGEEEAKLAKNAEDVTDDGIPVITVLVDGAWSKRSYRTNYNALSGVGCIIGVRTKKVIFVGVRNKYCKICSKGNTNSYICYKNWSGSSTGMEADIIVEGFRKSVEMHGVMYGRFIGDGDSNLYKKLISCARYGPQYVILKIECKNHLIRNYVNKLKELQKNTAYPITDRKLLESRIERLRVAVTCAAKFRGAKDLPRLEKIENLKNNIRNGPRHIFGDHQYKKYRVLHR